MPIRPIDPAKRGIQAVTETSNRPYISARSRIRAIDKASSTDTSSSEPPSETPKEQAPSPKRAHHKVNRTGDNWDENGDYIVGRGRPPQKHQWQPGQSGNSKGPKKKEKISPQEAFERKILVEFEIKQNGESVSTNLGDFALNLMKGAAAKGSLKAQLTLLQLYRDFVRKQASVNESEEMEAWEQEILDNFLAENGFKAAPVFRQSRDNPGDQGTEA